MKPVRLSGFVKFLLSVLSFFLCVALFATCVATITLAQTRTLTTEENMKTIIHYIMFGGEAKKAPVLVQAVGGMKLDEPSEEEGAPADLIVDMLYEMFAEQFGEEVPFEKEAVEELLDQSTLPDFLSDKMAGIMTDIYTGEVTTTITGAEVGQLIEENKQLIEDTFGIEVTDDYVSNIVEQVNSMDVTGMVHNVILGKDPTAAPDEGSPEGDTMGAPAMPDLFADGVLNALISGSASFEDVFSGGLPVILALIREVTSQEMLNMSLVACVILAALLCVVNFLQLHVAIRDVGITVMIASLPFMAASVVALAAPGLFTGMLKLLHIMFTLNAPLSIGVFVGGVVLLVVSIILGGIYNRKLEEV